ncbi:replication initiator protein [Dipodfec virus UOA04_Rod_680]|nr:replication initiator protein [Dipodfec virus UOA04_Rod_680]
MCTSPLVRYRSKVKNSPEVVVASGFFQIKSLKQLESYFGSYSAFRSYFDKYMDYQFIPCRKCTECKSDYASEWSVRCAHEFQIRKIASFITLTVDSSKASLFNTEKNMKKYCKRCVKGNRYIKYPIDYTLCKGMLLDELKRIRDNLYKRYGIKIRYFGCGEYGSEGDRPHYHVIIFGYDFPDKHTIDVSKKGIPIFHSEELQSMWKYGLATVQEVNHRACMYTAKYCLKKLKFCDDISEQEQYYGREPEFLVMSKGSCQSNRCPYIDEIVNNCKGMKSLRDLKNPYCKNCKYTRGGIGYDWFLKYGLDVLKIGHITLEGIKYPIPKYYLDVLKLTDETLYDRYKIKVLNRIDEYEEKHPEGRSQKQLDVRKKINKEKLKHYQRR